MVIFVEFKDKNDKFIYVRRNKEDPETLLLQKVPLAEWRGHKSSPIWNCFDAYTPKEASERDPNIPQPFWRCLRCSYVSEYKGYDDKAFNGFQSNLSAHVKKCFPFGEKSRDSRRDEDDPDLSILQQNFTKSILQTGLPYYQFTRSSSSDFGVYLKSCGVPVCNSQTFRNHCETLLTRAMGKVEEKLRGQYLCFLGDSTPAQNKREYLGMRVSFMDQFGDFHIVPLGVHRVIGNLSELSYSSHKNQVFAAYGIRDGVAEKTSDSDPVVVTGCADLGAGLSGVLAKGPKIGDFEPFGSCTLHGVFNIVKASAKMDQKTTGFYQKEHSPKDYFEEMQDFSSSLSKRLVRDRIEAEAKVRLKTAPTPKHSRWTFLKNLCLYTAEQTALIKGKSDLETENGKQFDLDSANLMAQVVASVYEPCWSYLERMQAVGPLDCFVMIMELFFMLGSLRKKRFFKPKLDSTDDDELMVVRLVLT